MSSSRLQIDFDRLPGFLREHRRFDGIVGLGLAPEASAEKRYVAGDVFFLQAERLGDFFLHALADFASATRPSPSRPEHPLPRPAVPSKRAPGAERSIPLRRSLPPLANSASGSPMVCTTFARLARGLLQFLLIVGRVVAGVAAVVPVDLELLAAFECGPRVVGDDRDAAERLKRVRRLKRIDRDGLLHADHFQSRRIVDRFDFSSEHRRMRNRRVKHAIDPNVHAEQRLAGADLGDVVSGRGLADIAPLLAAT